MIRERAAGASSDMGSEHYCLRWNNHQSNLLGVFSQLLQDESLVDVTLACSEGASIRAHKVVLSACSSYFQSLFIDHPSRHPIVILKDVHFSELRTLVDFMYKGEVNVEYCQLSALLKTAESLKVKGLAEMTNVNSSTAMEVEGGSESPPEPQDLAVVRAPPPEPEPRRPETPAPAEAASPPPRSSPLRRSRNEGGRHHHHLHHHHHHHHHDPKHSSGDGGGGHEPPVRDPGGKDDDPPDEAMPTAAPSSPDDDHSLQSNCAHSDNVGNACGDRVPTPIRGLKYPLDFDSPTGKSFFPTLNLSLSANNNSLLSCNPVELRLGLPGLSGVSGEPIAGPSGLPPVQQVPLSLKKEVDWDRQHDDNKSCGESSSEYRHPVHESLTLDSSPGSSRSGTPLAGLSAALLALLQRRALQDLLPHRGLHHHHHHHLPPPPPLPRHCHTSYPFLDEAGARDYRCPACFAAFPSAWLLERHAALQHPPGPDEKPFVCEQCGQSYRYRSAYVKHREQNHRARLPADKLFTCDVCGMQFRYLKSFKKHRLNHALERLHGKGGAPLLDSSDHQVTSTNDGVLLTRTVEMDLSTARRDSSITDAEDSDIESRKSTTAPPDDQDDTVDSIAPHNVVEVVENSDETPPLESVPSKKAEAVSFANVSSIADSSVNNNDPSTSEGASLVGCPSSNLMANQEAASSLLNYLRSSDTTDRQRERRFACPFCGKCVRSKENLKLHVRKHTGERPFVCLFCGRAFGGKSDLTRHLRIHTGERPYHCEACGKCFARADYLSKHLTTHIHNAPR